MPPPFRPLSLWKAKSVLIHPPGWLYSPLKVRVWVRSCRGRNAGTPCPKSFDRPSSQVATNWDAPELSARQNSSKNQPAMCLPLNCTNHIPVTSRHAWWREKAETRPEPCCTRWQWDTLTTGGFWGQGMVGRAAAVGGLGLASLQGKGEGKQKP